MTLTVYSRIFLHVSTSYFEFYNKLLLVSKMLKNLKSYKGFDFLILIRNCPSFPPIFTLKVSSIVVFSSLERAMNQASVSVSTTTPCRISEDLLPQEENQII